MKNIEKLDVTDYLTSSRQSHDTEDIIDDALAIIRYAEEFDITITEAAAIFSAAAQLQSARTLNGARLALHEIKLVIEQLG